MMLKRAPSLTDQARNHIRELILAGEFPDGRIPPETELAEALGISRTTVRDALSRLEIEGAITRKQGAGTFVNAPMLQIKSRLDEIWSYTDMLEAHGFTPATRILKVIQTTANSPSAGPHAAADLRLDPTEPVLIVRKLFLENDQPAILARNVVPLRYLTETYQREDLARPVYDLLETFGPQRLSYYLSDIVPMTADDDLAEVLQIAAGTPLIAFEETGYNSDNEPILKAYSYFRDDLLRFRILRRRV